jgi:hypothetical protein
MEKVIELIEKRGGQYLIHWLSELEKENEKLPANFDWLFFAEKISSKAFSENHFDLDFAKSAVLVYERIYKDGSTGALLSAMYIKLRILEIVPASELEPFLQPEVIKNAVKERLTITAAEAKKMTSNWQILEIENIKLLREFKNWMTVLLRLEKITHQKYDEFEEWKKIIHLLP